MVYLHPVFFIVYHFVLSVYHWIKYNVFRLFSPLVEAYMAYKLGKIGIKINGKNPWDIQILDREAYARMGTYYSLGIAEAYINKSAHIEDIVESVTRTCTGDNYKTVFDYNFHHYFNLQTRSRAFEVAKKHYDIGNDLFEAMLDPWMQYSCGYWRTATNLEEAQLAKMDLIARKLMLKPGMRILDVGCGFGSFAKYLAENYDVHVVGITISEEQVKYAKKHFAHPNVEIRLLDYREMHDVFDRVVAIEVLFHIGPANYPSFFQMARRCLQDDGIFLLHNIGICDKKFPSWEPFLHKYIFPNMMMPHQDELVTSITGLFYIEDWHNIGHDFSQTFLAWEEKFQKAWPKLQSSYDEKFYRMWVYYLRFSAGAFKSRKINLWHLVLTKNGMKGGYMSVR